MVVYPTLTRTSSDLRILAASLLPPSPILKADDLLVSSTSGEIPMLLDISMTTFACDSLIPLYGGIARTCDAAEGQIEGLGNTTGTFGPTTRCRANLKLKPEYSVKSNNSLVGEPLANSDEVFFTTDLSNTFDSELPGDSSRCTLYDILKISPPTYQDIAGDSGHPPSPSAKLRSILGQAQNIALQKASYHPTEESTKPIALSPAPKENDDHHLLTLTAFHTYSTLPTPRFALPSPSPSVDLISLTSPIWPQRHRRPLERARAVRLHGRPRSPTSLQADEAEPEAVHSQPSSLATKHAISSRWRLSNSSSSLSVRSCPSTYLPESQVSGLTYSFAKFVALPKNLSWLKQVTIDLWIDQEGFRAIRPTMQLMGYSPRSRSLQPYGTLGDAGSDITAGVAEFMPMRRETFAFHYATLDGPPTLRMLSVGGDESRDYISRQATLSVKSNGVYTVLGTETFLASILSEIHGSRSENVKLRWKFDYLVSDRKVDATGKTLPGEKTLTPLTFSCSPYLLHPLQGKKTALMHIVKKNLVPKLGSQKLEPPVCPPSHSTMPPYQPSTWRSFSTHARSHSDASTKRGHHPTTRSPLGVGTRGGIIRGTSQLQYVRRRRASSAGEHSLPIPREDLVGGPTTLRHAPIGLHIMPPAELSRMIISAE